MTTHVGSHCLSTLSCYGEIVCRVSFQQIFSPLVIGLTEKEHEGKRWHVCPQ